MASRSRAIPQRAAELLATIGRVEERSGYRAERLLGEPPAAAARS